MQIWLEICGVAALAALGAGVGKWLSKRGRVAILLGCAAPLVLVILIAISRRKEELVFHWPFTWLTAGRVEFVTLAFAGTVLLLAPLSRLKHDRERRLIKLFCLVAVFYFSLLPFIQPAISRPQMQAIETRIDDEGVCRQHFPYTCGPAAAVTGLVRLGIDAEEGDIAIAAHTSPIAGTAPDILADALEELYSEQGLQCEYVWLGQLGALPDDAVTPAVIRHSMMYDHFVCVIRVRPDFLIIGDPANGLVEMSHEEFRQRWRGSGVVLRRD